MNQQQTIHSSGPRPRQHSSEFSDGEKRETETATTMPSMHTRTHHDSGTLKSPHWHDVKREISVRLTSESQHLKKRIVRTNSRTQFKGPPPPIPKWIDIPPPTPPSKNRPILRQQENNPLPLSDLAMIMSRQLTVAIEKGSFGDLEDKHDEE